MAAGSWLWLLAGFAVFMALMWSVYAVNRAVALRQGYEPFSLPNAALMLVVNLLLLSALTPEAPHAAADGTGASLARVVKLTAAALLASGMLVLLARRVGLWVGLYATALMSVGAIAVLPSLIFMRLAATSATTSVREAQKRKQERE
jgi:hypothetical protein